MIKKERRKPNDPARFIGKVAATEDGETAKIHNYLDTEKIEQEALYDGMYAVTTDLLDDDVKDNLKSQRRSIGKSRNVSVIIEKLYFENKIHFFIQVVQHDQ